MLYLVIVESPAKKQKIQSFLNTIPNHSFIVEASCGHIRYFKNGLKSIDISNNFKPTYDIIKTKKDVVKNLKFKLKEANEVIIATDIDREGEAIGYHVAECLGLNIAETKRICFNEITKKALVDAFHNPRELDANLYNAQQTRSILDLLIGFEISPLLWSNIQAKLSAGRCQSPALKLLIQKENVIKNFTSNKSYNLSAEFTIFNKINATYYKEVKNREKIVKLLPKLVKYEYKLDNCKKSNSTSAAPAPYITSSIQQDASSKFGMSPTVTMSVLQKLYEKGKITYMRTDSTYIADTFIENIKEYCDEKYPGLFQKKEFKPKTDNAQEAHECIRPVKLVEIDDEFDANEQKLYKIIFNRTIACQMKKYKEEVYEYTLTSTKKDIHKFKFTLKKIIDLGYKKVYTSDTSDDQELIEKIELNSLFKPNKIEAIEKNTKPTPRYTEASLIKELEDKGIGRPSTFATIVAKLFERKYALKQTKHNYKDIELETFCIKPKEKLEIKTKKSKSVSEKNKIFTTDTGELVSEFMDNHFSNIVSYDFTSEVESDLDKVADGNEEWTEIISKVYNTFHPTVDKLKSDSSINKTYKDKKLKSIGQYQDKNVYTYIGKYGPCIQLGEHGESPKYASISKDDYPDINEIKLEDVIHLLKYPIDLGEHESKKILIKKGPHGLYINHNGNNVSIEDDSITLEQAIEKLNEKKSNVIKEFKDLKIMNGKFGPYIKKGSKNVSIPKSKDPAKLSKKECLEIIKNYKPKTFKKKAKKAKS